MKRIRLYAMFLGLLTCAAVANAQQKLALFDANGKPVSGAQVLAIAGGNKLVELPPTDSSGTVDLSALAGMENVTNKPITVYIKQCGNNPPVEVLVFQGQPLPQEPNCSYKKAGVLVLGSSGRWTFKPEPGSGYSLQVTGAPAAPQAPAVEGPSPFAAALSLGMGLAQLPGLGSVCQDFTGGTCSASNKAFLVSGGAQLYFGPAYVRGGGMHSGTVSVSASGGTDGETFSEKEEANFNAGEVVGGVNLFCVHNLFTVSPEGGVMFGTVHFTDSFSTGTGGPTGGSTFRQSAGFVGPVYGAEVMFKLPKHFGAGFRYGHTIIRTEGQSSMTANLYQGFIKYVFGTPGSLFHFLH